MQDNAGQKLGVVVTLVDGPLGGLPHSGEGLRQQVVQALALLKAGTAIGMNANVLFPGSWENVAGGAKSSMLAKKDSRFDLTLTVDLAKRSVSATINDRTLTFPLPEDIKQIRYFGPYVKGTSSAFAPIEVVEAK